MNISRLSLVVVFLLAGCVLLSDWKTEYRGKMVSVVMLNEDGTIKDVHVVEGEQVRTAYGQGVKVGDIHHVGSYHISVIE